MQLAIASPINRATRHLPTWLVYIAGLVPLAWVVWLVLSGGIGVDPVKGIEHRLGKIALWFLMGGLVISPLRRTTGVNLLRYRRAVGLLGFFYVALHLAAWVVLDMALLWGQLLPDLYRRPYLFFGIAAFVLMIPLALTSNKASIRHLGKNWRRLHWLVYPAVGLGVLHYVWQMKVISQEGWIWIAAFTLLMLLRGGWGLMGR
ncbi:protein-methionine-sulfoxide reductase heme-binding subunit MsrQ [Thioclava litoralis]|uniref:Protein-methionine-sulfoxide reductase heme-binding subunit MsrQ n=1 Tax=Thioclava litoralis TaxID=3076557 RepID=A0ABZ1E335_9RHOB|nr:protein-methionine-sulfoxide reductase heme-binding subunit MsrQ [Thioclava sp. FTW29]